MDHDDQIMLWVDLSVRHDRRGQEALYRHYYPIFFPLCMTYVVNNDDAIDIYNRAFLKIFSSIGQYQNKGAFGAWVRKIIVNSAIDFIRSNKNIQLHTSIEDAPDVYVESNILADMTADEILALFRFLPPAQRLVMNLFVVEGKSHAEIGKELNISVGTSKWHLNQARKLIQEKIYETGILTR